MYSYPSLEVDERTLELRSVLMVTSAEVEVIPMVIESMGIHLMPSMLMGRVDPPNGNEYEFSSVTS